MTTLLAPEIDDSCNDDNRDLHVKDFKQYPPNEIGTVVYRMSAGPWGRIEQCAGGQWVLVDSDGRFKFRYGIGQTVHDAILNYIDDYNRCGLDGGPRQPRLSDAQTPQELYSRSRIRAERIVNILNSVGSAPTAKHDDFRACPPEIMDAVISLTHELLNDWESLCGSGGNLFWVGEERKKVAYRIEALQERWACKPLPRF